MRPPPFSSMAGGRREVSTERSEALNTARRLCRALESAPDPARQAQAIATSLLKVGGWTHAGQGQLIAFTDWLQSRPPPSSLKARCRALLTALEIGR